MPRKRVLTHSILSWNASRGRMSKEILKAAIRTRIEEDGDDYSLGLSWIAQNPERAAWFGTRDGLTELGDEDIVDLYAEFVAADADQPLPEQDAIMFVRDVLVFNVLLYPVWVSRAIEKGHTRQHISQVILAMLEHCAVPGNFFNGVSFIEDSLPQNINIFHEVMDDDQFWQALRLCAQRHPRVLFDDTPYSLLMDNAFPPPSLLQQLLGHLGDEKLQELLGIAARNLDSPLIDGGSFKYMRQADVLALMQRLRGGSYGLVMAAAALFDNTTGRRLLQDYGHCFDNPVGKDEGFAYHYWLIRTKAQYPDMSDELRSDILAAMEVHLDAIGWMISTMVERQIQDEPTLCIVHDGVHYVEYHWLTPGRPPFGSSDYQPVVGDVVMFSPRSMTQTQYELSTDGSIMGVQMSLLERPASG